MSLLEYGFTKANVDNHLQTTPKKRKDALATPLHELKKISPEKITKKYTTGTKQNFSPGKSSRELPSKFGKISPKISLIKQNPSSSNSEKGHIKIQKSTINSYEKPIKTKMCNGNMQDGDKKVKQLLSKTAQKTPSSDVKPASKKMKPPSDISLKSPMSPNKAGLAVHNSYKVEKPLASVNKNLKNNEKNVPLITVEDCNDIIAFPSPRNSSLNNTSPNQEVAASLPLQRIKLIMKSCPDVEVVPQDALYMISKATELFIKLLVNESLEASKSSSVNYECLSDVIHTRERLDFLKETVPKKITWAECQRLMAAKDNDSMLDYL